MGSFEHVNFPAPPEKREAIQLAIEKIGREATGETPDVEFRGDTCVVGEYELPRVSYRDVSALDEVPADRLVYADYNDTSDGGTGYVFERVDGTFVRTDRYDVGSPDYVFTPEYFRLNYGLDVKYSLGTFETWGRTDRVTADEDWEQILTRDATTVDVSDAELAEILDVERLYTERELSETVTIEDIANLLNSDAYYRVAGRILHDVQDSVPSETIDELESDDEDERDRAVRHVAAVGVNSPEAYHRFLRALPTVSERTRTLVAAELWTPSVLDGDADPGRATVEELLSLVDDPVPELRFGALVGAAAVIKSLARTTDRSESMPEPVVELADPYCEAFGTILSDEDVRLREAAVRLGFTPTGSGVLGPFLNYLWVHVGPDVRWQTARAHGYIATADDAATVREEAGSLLISCVFDTGPHEALSSTDVDQELPSRETIDEMIDHAYVEQRHQYETVRENLGRIAWHAPTLVEEAVEHAVEAFVSEPDATGNLELLAATAERFPERVAAARDELASLAKQSASERRRLHADYALSQLPSVDHDLRVTMSDVSKNLEDDRGKLDPGAVTLLTEIAPDTAVEFLDSVLENLAAESADTEYDREQIVEAVDAARSANLDLAANQLPHSEELP